MAAVSNIPKDIHDSIRDVMDRRIKLGIKRMVRQEIRNDRTENRVLAFSPCRLFVLAAKVPSKLEQTFHYLDIQAIESRKSNQLQITVDGKCFSFITQDADTEEVNHMITHIGTSLKNIFPTFPLERIILKIDVQPKERLKTMEDMMREVEGKELGPCGGFTMMYACMCDYHSLPYREEVAWDVDTIYLSQDSRELCLRDFDHLNMKDLVPIIGALEHNSWFTKLSASNVKLTTECCNEILKVMRRNAVIEHLDLSSTGIKVEFVQKLATALLSNSGTQISKINLSSNTLEDRGMLHLIGSFNNLPKGLTSLDLSKTDLTTKCLNKIAESMTQNKTISSTLQMLKLSENSTKPEDLANLYKFLARPNSISHLDLSSTDIALDMLSGALLRGCNLQLMHLKLSSVVFSHKKSKDVVIPPTWKQFFSSAAVLEHVDLSNCRLPSDAIKELFLGIASNRYIDNLHLDLSGNELGSQGAHNIGDTISHIKNITSLDISNNGFDQELRNLLPEISRSSSLRHLSIGRNFSGIKPKYQLRTLDHVVQLIQDEDSSIQSLSLVDSKLKADTAYVVNALGSNKTLREIDLSGNQMGDLGARMLAKALQINSHMQTIRWDRNSTTAQGFEDIADALEKNFTLKKMPFPVEDAAASFRIHPVRTEAALQKIESLLQRNHNPRKFASDQAYRLQQGFLLSSTQQMVDRLVIQVQDTIDVLNLKPNEAFKADIEEATEIVKDADNSKQLLPRLQEIAIKSQDSGNPVEKSLQKMADDLRQVMEKQMKKTVEDMLKCTATHCSAVMADKTFQSEMEDGCHSRSTIPKDVTKLMLEGVGNDMYNKLSEMNLAVAAHLSDSAIDQVIDVLSKSHKTLLNHLNLRKNDPVKEEKADTETEKKASKESLEIELDNNPSAGPFFMDTKRQDESPKLSNKRKSLYGRKLRPQSVIEDDIYVFDVTNPMISKGYPKLHVDEIDSSFDRLDSLNETPEKLKSIGDPWEKTETTTSLQHLVKSRPKRQKNRAPTRPVAPTTSPLEDDSDGMGAFYVPPTVSAEPVTPSRRNSETNKPASSPKPIETSKSEKKKGWPLFHSKDKDKDKDKEKDKEKEKSEKKGSSFTHGLSNFFGRKSGGKGTKTLEADPRRSVETSPAIQEEKKAVKEEKKPASPAKQSVFHMKRTEEAVEEKVESKAPIVSAESFEEEKNQADKDKEREDEEKEEKEEAGDSVSKLHGGTPRIGLGGNILLEMKQKQEKRLSKVQPSATAQTQSESKEKDKHLEANNNVIEKNKAQKSGEKNAVLMPSTSKTEPPSKPDTGTTSASTSKDSPDPEKKDGDAKTSDKPAKPNTETKKQLTIPVEPVPTDKSPRPAPRALQPPKKPSTPVDTEATVTIDAKPIAAARSSVKPPPPTKPRPPLLPPKPRASARLSKDVTDSPVLSDVSMREKTDSEIVTDSPTLRLSVRDKIKRLSKSPLDESPLTKSKPNSPENKPESSSDEADAGSRPASLDRLNGDATSSSKDSPDSSKPSPEHSSINSSDANESLDTKEKKPSPSSPKDEPSAPKPRPASKTDDEIMV